MIEKLLKNKTSKEKAKIKSQELAKVKISKFTKDDLEVEIVGDIINVDNHIEFYAKAWKNGKQLGFGKKGDVEVERFIIHNPPVLVDNPNGEIIREWTNEKGELKQRKLKYDPAQALKNSLAHTISLVAKDGKDIIKGKVGNTTSTFYPSLDGRTYRHAVDETFATLLVGAGTGATYADTTSPAGEIGSSTTTNQFNQLVRAMFLFDTSAIPDTDGIDSAVLSLYCSSKSNLLSGEGSANSAIVLMASTPASNSELVAADHTQYGTTEFGRTGIQSGISTAAYTDITLNVSGEADISKTGISKFGTKYGWDFDATSTGLTWASNVLQNIKIYNSEQTGTDKDPKLVVVHSAEAITFSVADSFSLSESQKSLRGLKSTAVDSFSLHDTQKSLRGLKFSVADNFNLSDIFSSLKGFFFNVVDSINLTEKISSTRSLVFSVADSLSLTDSTKALRKIKFVVVSVISLADKFITAIKKGYIQMRSKKQNYPIGMNDENDIAMKSKQQNYPIGMNDDRTL